MWTCQSALVARPRPHCNTTSSPPAPDHTHFSVVPYLHAGRIPADPVWNADCGGHCRALTTRILDHPRLTAGYVVRV